MSYCSSFYDYGVYISMMRFNLHFNCTLSQFKPDATTFCNMKPSYLYYIIQNHHQKGLGEKLLHTVSLTKDVLNNIENACSTF